MRYRFFRTRLMGFASGLALLSAAGVAALASSEADAMTLQEAVAYTVETNPEIGEATSNREAIDFELRQARGLYLPQIDLEGSYGPGWRNGPGVDDRDDHTWLQRRQLSATLQQLIFDGFATDAEVERQAARRDAAAYRVLERSEFLGLDVVQIYLDVMRWTEQVELAQENVRIHEEYLSNVNQRARAGRSSTADVRQAEQRLAAAETTLVEIERGFEEARITYLQLVGVPADELILPPPVGGVVPVDMNQAISRGLENNPTLRLARADIDTAYAEFRAAVANFYPELTLESRYARGWDVNGERGIDEDFEALLVLRYNLYRGGIDSANREEQVRRIDESRQSVLLFQREVEQEVRISYNELDAATASEVLLEQEVVAAEETRNAYQQQFTIGQRTLLDLLDSQNELFNARLTLATTRYARIFAEHRVLASMGDLLITLGVTPPPSATADARVNAGVPTTPESETMPRTDEIFPFSND